MAKIWRVLSVFYTYYCAMACEYTRFVNSKGLKYSSASSMSLQCHLCALVTLGMSRIAWILARTVSIRVMTLWLTASFRYRRRPIHLLC
jgi:hypothetical protein